MDKPKHDQVAFRRALQLAQASSMHLHLAAFCYDPMVDQTESFEPGLRAEIKKGLIGDRKRWLKDQVRDANAGIENLTSETVWTKELANWIVEKAGAGKFDLVMKTVHKSQTLTHTPSDWTLLRYCPAPVLLCTRKRWRQRPQIVVALDLKRNDRSHKRLNVKALDAAAWFAEKYGGQLHCVYAIEVSRVLSDLDIVDPRRIRNDAREKARETLEDLIAPYDIPKSRVHMPIGKVGHAVNKVASTVKADLLVMGTTSRTGIKGLVIGNAAEKVLTRARCEILALKP